MTPRPKLLLIASGFTAFALAGFAKARIASLSPEQYIAARQASLDMSAWVNGSMREAMKSGGEAKTQGYAATGLAKWARVLPTLFPAGTGQGETPSKTQALPTVWGDRAGFEKAAADYAEAADELVTLAKANDTAGFKAKLDELKLACDACHNRFKEGDRGSK